MPTMPTPFDDIPDEESFWNETDGWEEETFTCEYCGAEIDDEYHEDCPNQQMTAIKWTCDKAETLPQAAQALRDLADWLISQHEAGWALQQPVDNGHFFMVLPKTTSVG